MPPLGGDPQQIASYLNETVWGGYTRLRRPWLRQVEQNVRALAGQQYDEYLDSAGQFVNVAAYFLPEDERWRRAPVFNWLKQTWFISALAKLTENIPILGALPATADQVDAQTAAIFDPFFRYEWAQMGMPEKMFDLYGWLLTAGEAWVMLRWDPDRGQPEEFYGPSSFEVGPGHPVTDAPYVRQGSTFGPAYLKDESGEVMVDEVGQPIVDPTALPHTQPIGDFAAAILAPTSVLVPYGPEPYYEKPWVMREYFEDVGVVQAKFGVTVSPDTGPTTDADGRDTLRQMSYSSPYLNTGSWGAAFGGFSTDGDAFATANMVRLRERWERACPSYPYGRLTIVTATTGQVLYDDINPYVIPGERNEVIIPLYRFRKPDLPFRQEGSSDLESLNPVARALNRALGGMLDFADHNEQPVKVFNRHLFADDVAGELNRPGAVVGADGDPQRAIHVLNPPTMPDAVGQVPDRLRGWLEVLGNTGVSASGNAVTESASGELQREVRFDSDRPWGATLRLNSFDWARIGGDLIKMAAVCMDDDRTLAIAGEDQALTFLTVRGELFQGRVNVQAMPESYVMETRQDKQMRVKELIAMGLPPEQGLKVLGYPDVNRALRPPAYSLAQRLVAEMVQTGQLAPVLPEHDHGVFIQVAKEFQQTATYLNLPPEIQNVIRVWVQMHELFGAQEAIRQTSLAAGVQGMAALTQTTAQAPARKQQMQVEREANPEAFVSGAPQRGPGGRANRMTGLPQ